MPHPNLHQNSFSDIICLSREMFYFVVLDYYDWRMKYFMLLLTPCFHSAALCGSNQLWKDEEEAGPKERSQKPTNEKTPCWPYRRPVMLADWALRQQWDKHGGVHSSTAPGGKPSIVGVNFPHGGDSSPQHSRRLCRFPAGLGGASSPPLWVQIQLQRTAPVSVRRQYPVLDPQWK